MPRGEVMREMWWSGSVRRRHGAVLQHVHTASRAVSVRAYRAKRVFQVLGRSAVYLVIVGMCRWFCIRSSVGRTDWLR